MLWRIAVCACAFVSFAVAAGRIPYHAMAEGQEWRCNTGYYRTSSMRATCARCRPLQCEAGWYAAECSSTMDGACVQCPPVPGAVFGSECRVLRCLAGYYLRVGGISAGCTQCPRGSVCADGIAAVPCAGNCTTNVNGADSALMCSPKVDAEGSPKVDAEGSPKVDASITYFIAATDYSRLRVGLKLEWPPYVATRGCALRGGGEFTCVVSMPKCVADIVFQWWSERIDVSSDAMALNITGFRGPPRVEMQKYSHTEAAGVEARWPDFVVEPRKWGQTRYQYFLTLWAMSGVVFGMFVVAGWMCLLLHLRR